MLFRDFVFCYLRSDHLIFYGGQEVHADQCLWFKLHKKRPFDYDGGGGRDVKKKKSKTFSKIISRT